MSSTKQKVGLDGDTVVADYVSKLNYDIKASDNRCSVIKGQQFHSSKFEKVLRLSRKWAQKRNWHDKHSFCLESIRWRKRQRLHQDVAFK